METATPTQHMHEAFELLFPEIDPATPLGLKTPERIATCIAVAVLAYGAATGNLTVTAAGLILTIFSLAVPASATPRRIRREARSRFPHEPWAEHNPASSVKTDLLVPAFWLFIAVISLGTLYITPDSYSTWGGGAAAAIALVATWFMPGLSPAWVRASA